MLEVKFYDTVDDALLKFAVIISKSNGKWVMCKHKECYDCGEEAVCINEDLLPVGTCMSCGYINSVYKCEHCLLWFNSDEEGRVFDDIAFCQNCLDMYEEE